jgi:TatD DNase family protein
MIDIHCHLEQSEYNDDRNEIIEKCKKELKAIITCCAHPNDFDLTMEMVEKYKNFVFATAGIHPEYIKEVKEKDVDNFVELMKENKHKIVGIGEIGLDYWWIKEESWQKKQKELFIQLIEVAKEMKKPIIVHSRKAFDDSIKILEQEDARKVVLHMWGGLHLVKRIIENDWFISMNAIVLRSKKHKKVIRDCPLEKLMLETDSPWLSPKKLLEGTEIRNDPTSIRVVAEKIADIKKLPFSKVWSQCGRNAVNFFKLPISLF